MTPQICELDEVVWNLVMSTTKIISSHPKSYYNQNAGRVAPDCALVTPVIHSNVVKRSQARRINSGDGTIFISELAFQFKNIITIM
jgi:hypothetical protein